MRTQTIRRGARRRCFPPGCLLARPDRRGPVRVRVCRPAGVALPGQLPLLARITSLGQGGARVWVPLEFYVDQVLLLSFEWGPALQFLDLRCRIAWVRLDSAGGWQVGLKFFDLTSTEAASLAAVWQANGPAAAADPQGA